MEVIKEAGATREQNDKGTRKGGRDMVEDEDREARVYKRQDDWEAIREVIMEVARRKWHGCGGRHV